MIHGYIIVLKRNGDDGHELPVKKSVKIGRGAHCDVRIVVQSVSEQHCLIIVEKDEKALVQNLSSTSQTLVNGVSIGKESYALKHGDIVTLGERSFRWQYSQLSSYYEGETDVSQKRRKSETDSVVGSQNIAIVNPLYHKRRTVGPSITFKKLLKTETATDLKQGDVGRSLTSERASVKTPISSKSKAVRTPARMSLGRSPKLRLNASKVNTTPSPNAEDLEPASTTPASKLSPKHSDDVKSPANRTPAGKSLAVKTPAAKSPALRISAAKLLTPKSPTAKSPASKSPGAKTPASKSLGVKTPASKSPAVKTPASKSPAAKTPASKSPAAKTPASKSPAAKTPASKSPAVKTPASKTPGVKTPTSKSPAVKTPASKTPGVKTPASKSPAVKTPASKTPAAKSKTPKVVQHGSKRKSKTLKSPMKSSKGQKRRLSSPPPVAAKRFKIESPKTIDKKKMAVLMGIHGKTPRVPSSSTLSSVKVVLSGKKTPIIKAIKTPRSSTVKRAGGAINSSVKKSRRPLFSEILKKKAVKTANAVAKKIVLDPLPAKAVTKNVKKTVVMSTEIPQKFKFGSTGHANSPEPIFIGRKVVKTPVLTKKGRKAPMLVHQVLKGNMDLSGLSEMFETPGKGKPQEASNSPSKTVKERVSSAKATRSRSSTPSAVSRVSRNSVKLTDTSEMIFTSQSPPSTPKSVSKSRSPGNAKPSSSSKSSSPPTRVMEEKLDARTPQSISRSVSQATMSSSKKRHSLLTSTPAVLGRRQSFAESAFESPSSLLTGQISAPQSPASGRKSRLDMVAPRTSYIHSPHASPVKSSLKSSPSKSPPSGGHGKSLSVSFNNSIHIKMLVPGSKKSLNTTAPLSSPLSEGNSGVATPDLTTFDFSSIKTPNVPRDMFVSSILSSRASTSSQASGSAKRKGKAPKSPKNDLSDVRGVRRLLKTPSSPPGYVNVKGIKRLMTVSCKTPTYLAVEGVKKLFSDAAVAAGNSGNDLSSFAGVRELFASPSPTKTRQRVSSKASPKGSPKESSPVVKIQAEVESKGRSSGSSFSSKVYSPVKSSPEQNSTKEASTFRSSIGLASSAAKEDVTSKGRTTRNKRIISSPSVTPSTTGEESPKRGRAGRRKGGSATSTQENKIAEKTPTRSSETQLTTQRRTRKVEKELSPKQVVESPPKRRTRKAAKASTPSIKSPEQELPKTRTRKGATSKKAVPEANSAKEDGITLVTSPKSAKVTTKRATSRKTAAPKTPSPVKSPPTKRATRRGAKTAASSPKPTKRALSPSGDSTESPVKKIKTVVEPASPVKSPPKRTTRRKKGASPAKEMVFEQQNATAARKRKAVTFDDQVVTPKTGKVDAGVSPELNKRTKRATSKRDQQLSQDGSSPSNKKKASKNAVVTVSPRKTRSRK